MPLALMTINKRQSLALGFGIVALVASIACPPHTMNSGLFGGTRYVPLWGHLRPDEYPDIDWWLLGLQATFIVEAAFSAIVLVGKRLNRAQIGSAYTSIGAALLIAIGFAFDYRSIFEPDLTLILLNIVGLAAAVLTCVFGRVRL